MYKSEHSYIPSLQIETIGVSAGVTLKEGDRIKKGHPLVSPTCTSSSYSNPRVHCTRLVHYRRATSWRSSARSSCCRCGRCAYAARRVPRLGRSTRWTLPRAPTSRPLRSRPALQPQGREANYSSRCLRRPLCPRNSLRSAQPSNKTLVEIIRRLSKPD